MNASGDLQLSGNLKVTFVLFWFLPRDAMHKRGLCRHAVSVCLSVCLCVVNSVKTNKHIFNIFSPSGKPSRSIFLIIKRYSNIPTGIPLGVDAGGVGRNCDSEPISGFPAYGKSYAVKRSSGQCSKLSCDEPCRVYWLVAWHSW